ncbi:MAG TPA: type IV toxin-antitoxin system AbiEi family antitoxin domain-containing protein, partial [Actinomycetota bacterium]|nr:type IV toxin-antitoxin system AbiEi family antitoxin domain-containing protein [Actinomycetota bacterium]
MSIEYRGSCDAESPDQICRSIAQSQFGVITRKQAQEAGLSTNQFDRRVAAGIFARIHPTVYRLVGVPASWKGRLFAAQEWAGDRAVVSHRAAAKLYSLDGIDEEYIELTTTGSSCRSRPGVVLHRTSELEQKDWRSKHPFRVTTPERTICDLASVLSSAALESALESALRLRLTTLRRIAQMS